ncbi:MAG TPA: papain-like cysteine protease family protein [Vicinamibacterales bacterium]
MILALLAVLSLGQGAAIDVPFVPQTDALCGGASAAMVFRYWGDAHADAEQFASLVQHRSDGAAGIAGSVLAVAVRTKGWRTESTDGSIDALRARLAARQPIVVLLSERGNLYHYVVVVGLSDTGVVVHDPSWGPYQVIATADFERRWRDASRWSLVILPDGARTANGPTVVDREGARGFSRAAPTDPWESEVARAINEHRWADAAALARDAIGRDQNDEYAHLVLGTSLFMLDDEVGALRAWNAIGQPRLNELNIEGLQRSRYQILADALGLRPNAVLTADAFLRARHRLDELPDRASARLALRPEDEGFASVDVVVSEKAGLPRGRAEWMGTGARVAINREIAVSLPGATGQGEIWSASWRWWNNRPKAAFAFAAPHVAGLFGVWRVEGSWETESYTTGGSQLQREMRGHGALTVSDWLTGAVRYSLSGGVDTWGALRAASAGASLERRWLDDRVAAAATATTWWPLASDTPATNFSAIGVRVSAASRPVSRGWRYIATAGADVVSDNAPLTLWPGAGEGWARPVLLRAHPLLDDGAIDVGGRTVFGRSVQYASAETQRWLARPAIVRLGFAGFVDIAQARRQMIATPQVPLQTDVGAGLRLHLPGDSRVLRVDFAHGLRDGANAISVGWSY